MKILVLNGSPRKGNTVSAISAFAEGASAKNEVEIIDTYKLNVGPCLACDVCQCHKGCVATDDTNMIIDKIVAADLVVFATPVYWWGVTAQIKLVIDKMYCRGAQIKGKKIGVIVVGGAATDAEQYQLIRRQFACAAKSLSWDIVFHKEFSAMSKSDLGASADSMAEMKIVGENIQ